MITAKFRDLTDEERKALRIYLISNELILEKQLLLQVDSDSGKTKLSTEYHGYQAKPRDWWLSVDGINEHEKTARPDWKRIAEEHGLLQYMQEGKPEQSVNKALFERRLAGILVPA